MAFILIVSVALITVGILVYFSNTGIKIEKHKRGSVAGGSVMTSVPHERIRKELSDMQVPPEKAAEIAHRIGNYVDDQIKRQAETIRHEIKKVVEVKEQEIRKVKTEYETVHKNFQKLGKQKRQTETVVRHMAKGLVVVNDAGEVLFANPVAEKILGVKPNSMMGKPISTARGEHFITMVNEEGEEERSIAALEQDAETKEILKESTAIIENESGQTKGMVSILTGSTQIKRTDEFKNEFVANISHEFRTPLICIQKSIMAVQDELKHSNLTDHQRNYFDIALRNAKRLEKMAKDIIDISKIQSGKMSLRPEIFFAQHLVKDVKNMFAVWGRDKNIEIAEAITGDTLPVEADQERLHQVLINLVSNALKFTPRGGKITIEAKFIDEKDAKQKEDIGCLQIGVRDTGPGIPPEDLKKLFQKFSHASTTATEGEKGSGLGLTIAKEIVQLHGGRIWVESEVGKGTCFAFTVPKRPSGAIPSSGSTAVAGS